MSLAKFGSLTSKIWSWRRGTTTTATACNFLGSATVSKPRAAHLGDESFWAKGLVFRRDRTRGKLSLKSSSLSTVKGAKCILVAQRNEPKKTPWSGELGKKCIKMQWSSLFVASFSQNMTTTDGWFLTPRTRRGNCCSKAARPRS